MHAVQSRSAADRWPRDAQLLVSIFPGVDPNAVEKAIVRFPARRSGEPMPN